MSRKLNHSRIVKHSGLLLAVLAASPSWAQESGRRSPILWASHIYLAEAQSVTCDQGASGNGAAVSCDVSLLVLDTFKSPPPSSTTVTIHTDLPRSSGGITLYAGEPWGALDLESGDRLLLFTIADAGSGTQDRLFGERLRLAMGGDSARQTQDIADVRRGTAVLQAGDPGAAALQELTSGKDWGAMFAQLAWEILEPAAMQDPAVFQQVCSGIENSQAKPGGRAALVTDVFRHYIQIAPQVDNAAAGAFIQSLISVLASDSETDRAVQPYLPVPLDFIFVRNFQGVSLASLAPDVKARAVSNLRRLGDDRAAAIAANIARE
jgi:hypothetical protein